MPDPVSVPPWHPLDHPHCENCKGLSRPVRQKKPCDAPPVQLELGQALTFRKHTLAILRQAGIPRNLFASCVLGKVPSTLWAQLKAGRVPKITTLQLQSIQEVQRDGSKLLVTYDVGNLGIRWDTTLSRRAARDAHPDAALHMFVAKQANALAKQLHAHMFIVPRGRRQRKGRKLRQ